MAKDLTANAKTEGNDELTDALRAAISDPTDTRRLGYWLRGKAGRIAGGYQLTKVEEGRAGNQWQCRKV